MYSNFKDFKKSITLFFNAYGLREVYMLLKYNKLSLRGPNVSPMLISIVDNKRQAKGLTDRFKGIVSVYALAKATNVPFRCIYTHPIQLTDFLYPNEYNWLPEKAELSETISGVRFKLLRKQHTIKRLLKVFPLTKQIRVYANLDYLDEINRRYGRQYRWGVLFKELFKPTEVLESCLQDHLNRIGSKKYVACVFRFQALLGDFKEYHFQPLPEVERQRFIDRNLDALRQITERSEVPVLVTSDSTTFLMQANRLPNVYIIPGDVVHIDNTAGAGSAVYMKSFLDFLMLARAQHIYSIGTGAMYKTDFPAYAAKVNDVPFERILID